MKPDLPRLSELPLKNGTKVIAVRNFGPVKEGAPGIITGTSVYRFFWWWRPTYLCTFADNMRVATRPNEIEENDHGYSLEDLEQPDFVRDVWQRGRYVNPVDQYRLQTEKNLREAVDARRISKDKN
jgi:hypothetical protein